MPSSRKAQAGPDAIQLLKRDHEQVRRLFDEFERAHDERKFALATDICHALTVHAALEEEIFYPRVRDAIETEGIVLEAGIEHETVKRLIDRVQAGAIGVAELSATIRVMNDYVNHHVNEEQRRLFPRAKRSAIDLEALGRELEARRAELDSEVRSAINDGEDEDGDGEHGEEATRDDVEPGDSRGGMAARGSA